MAHYLCLKLVAGQGRVHGRGQNVEGVGHIGLQEDHLNRHRHDSQGDYWRPLHGQRYAARVKVHVRVPDWSLQGKYVDGVEGIGLWDVEEKDEVSAAVGPLVDANVKDKSIEQILRLRDCEGGSRA